MATISASWSADDSLIAAALTVLSGDDSSSPCTLVAAAGAAAEPCELTLRHAGAGISAVELVSSSRMVEVRAAGGEYLSSLKGKGCAVGAGLFAVRHELAPTLAEVRLRCLRTVPPGALTVHRCGVALAEAGAAGVAGVAEAPSAGAGGLDHAMLASLIGDDPQAQERYATFRKDLEAPAAAAVAAGVPPELARLLISGSGLGSGPRWPPARPSTSGGGAEGQHDGPPPGLAEAMAAPAATGVDPSTGRVAAAAEPVAPRQPPPAQTGAAVDAATVSAVAEMLERSLGAMEGRLKRHINECTRRLEARLDDLESEVARR